ncbi:hypothetical protein [Nodularia spumigena]|nr:hypothetical protein [Nodularia spumigena]
MKSDTAKAVSFAMAIPSQPNPISIFLPSCLHQVSILDFRLENAIAIGSN